MVLAGLLLAAVLAAVVVAVRLTHRDEVLPGTRMAGISLGGATETEARRRLAALEAEDAPLVLTTGRRVVRLRPSAAGHDLDERASARRAMRSGREGRLGGAWTTLKGLFTARDVPVVARIDRARLRDAVAGVAGRLDRPASVGALHVDDATLAVGVRSAPRQGREVDRRRLAKLVRAALRSDRQRVVIHVPIERTPAVSRARVRELAAAAEAYLQRPLRLAGAGAVVELSPRRLARLVELQPVDGGADARLGARAGRTRALAARLAEQVERSPRSARLSAPVRPVVFDPKGDASWRPRPARVRVRAGRAGRKLDQAALARSIDEAIRAGRHTASLGAEPVRARVTTAAARRADRLIGTFTTHYEPGQPRVRNIRRIARAIDGTVIAPGEQFSLNGISGPRTREKGYVPAPFITDGNRIVESVGGGVSQFSTTMYNAAYFAGLRIDTHQPHSLFIDRYPAGRESTLNYPDIDLKWTNDTGVPVLVRASGDPASVTVSLYGDNGGRRVRAESAPREPVPGGDFSVVVTRVMRYPDGRVARQPFTTRYEAEDA
ncbi:VanW family protein [Capillimicrobium parvum]|uniref:VanW family protein n=1 Tax=Capillimicrobium parvum TaxID=2884022 RepID=UPI00216B603F|nr:VanW family protein [Capillimicrobium parvum]